MLRPHGTVAPRAHPGAFVHGSAHLFKGPAGFRLHKTSGEADFVPTLFSGLTIRLASLWS